jgi:hypothetical protein
MAFHPWVDWYTGFLIGRMLDRETTVWDEMFLPVELGRHMRDFSFTDADGESRKLVSRATLLNQTKTRQPVLNIPPGNLARSFSIGLLIALCFVLTVHMGKKYPAARAVSGILQSTVGLVLGLTGLAILFAPVFAGNEYLAHNNNLFFINPLFFAAVPLGIITVAGKNLRSAQKAEKALRILWIYLFCTALAALLLNTLPSLRQQNESIIIFVLPVALAFTCGSKICGQSG